MTDFSDIYILPEYSDVISRGQVDTSTWLGNVQVDVPVISANMDTVTDGHMANAIWKAGGMGAIHRFAHVDDSVKEFRNAAGSPCFVSVGVKPRERDRALALYEAGATHFIIDIAHGHSKNMEDMLMWLREQLPSCLKDVFIVAGNVATGAAASRLFNLGADAVKVGIGPGAACTTKNVTGVTVPQVTAIKDVVDSKRHWNHMNRNAHPKKVIADGGVREIGDIAKALGLGADAVMCGRLFAGCPEAPQRGVYRGMASFDAMKQIRVTDELPTPEGKVVDIHDDKPVAEVVKLIKGGLQSAFSYSNAKTLKAFQNRCSFRDRRKIEQL